MIKEIFDEKCKNCSCEMECILDYSNSSMSGSNMKYWCSECGTIVEFYDSNSSPLPQDDEWKYPKIVEEQNRMKKNEYVVFVVKPMMIAHV